MSTRHLDAQIRALHQQQLSDGAIGEALGITNLAVRRARNRLGLAPTKGGILPPHDRGDEVLDSGLSSRIRTMEQLLEVTKVDLTQWEVARAIVNKWEVGMAHPETGAPVVEPLFQVKVWLKPRVADAKALFAALLEDMRAAAVRRDRPVRLVSRSRSEESHLLEVNLFDLHLGKLAWAEETGSHYDSRIAVDGARYALDDLLSQVGDRRIDEVVFPLGNDFFHTDNREGSTTAGTPMDRDSRYHLMFRRGRELASEMIERLLSIAPVKLVGVPGNHGRLAEWHLVELLAAEFRRERRLSVDNAPSPRKYVRYGNVLLGYTHGDGEPLEKLPQIMATEVPALWAGARHREWHVGHIHKSKRLDAVSVDSQNGVRVRIIPALSGTDAWSAGKGYVGEPRAAEAFLWSKSRGLRANLFTTVPDDVSAASSRRAA